MKLNPRDRKGQVLGDREDNKGTGGELAKVKSVCKSFTEIYNYVT